jgi:hypothetical protein
MATNIFMQKCPLGAACTIIGCKFEHPSTHSAVAAAPLPAAVRAAAVQDWTPNNQWAATPPQPQQLPQPQQQQQSSLTVVDWTPSNQWVATPAQQPVTTAATQPMEWTPQSQWQSTAEAPYQRDSYGLTLKSTPATTNSFNNNSKYSNNNYSSNNKVSKYNH